MPSLIILRATLRRDRLGLFRHVDDAHAALADLLQQLVGADLRAGAFQRRLVDGRTSAAGEWRFEKTCLLFVRGQKCVNAFEQILIGTADLAQILRPSVRRIDFPGDVEDRFFVELFAGHGSPALPP